MMNDEMNQKRWYNAFMRICLASEAAARHCLICEYPVTQINVEVVVLVLKPLLRTILIQCHVNVKHGPTRQICLEAGPSIIRDKFQVISDGSNE